MFDFLMGYVMGERAASRAATFARSAGAGSSAAVTGELHDINNRVDRLLLVVDAMWSLLRESGWSDEQLAQRIQELDGADGVVDGRRTPQAHRCAKCGAMVEAGRAACVFCGTEMETAPGVLDGI